MRVTIQSYTLKNNSFDEKTFIFWNGGQVCLSSIFDGWSDKIVEFDLKNSTYYSGLLQNTQW